VLHTEPLGVADHVGYRQCLNTGADLVHHGKQTGLEQARVWDHCMSLVHHLVHS
jgi:hypothetical protein